MGDFKIADDGCWTRADYRSADRVPPPEQTDEPYWAWAQIDADRRKATPALDIVAEVRYGFPEPELPADPTGIDCLERYEGVDA